MRTTILAACVISLATLLCLNVAAGEDVSKGQTQTVQGLYEMCKKPGGPDAAFCVGYIGGVHDMMMMVRLSDDEKLKDLRLCDPGSTRGAQVQVFASWAEKHPEHWSKLMFAGVVAALSTTWRCP
jgi:hypothetical protein